MTATPLARTDVATKELVELHSVEQTKGIQEALLRGQVAVLRGGLQQLGLLKTLEDISLEGIRNAAGEEVADRIRKTGFDRIHDVVHSEDIPRITDAVYEVMKRSAPGFLKRFVPLVFGIDRAFYFEREPHVRFHIPYDRAVLRRQQYEEFVRRRGEGKLTAHGPHRDSWLNCPDNSVNAWIAVGPVRLGNGLTFFPETYGKSLAYTSRGEITLDENPGHPLNIELQGGDVLLFHGDHLHASELNRTDSTRYVISFRLTLDKPHFPKGHFHHYLHSSLADGSYHWMAELPANLQWSYVRFRASWVSRKVLGLMTPSSSRHPAQNPPSVREANGAPVLSDLPVGGIRAVSRSACIARLSPDRVVAFSRRCPHQGADLANGSVRNGIVVCPWHNLTFDPETGASPCESLRALKLYPCTIQSGRIVVGADATA